MKYSVLSAIFALSLTACAHTAEPTVRTVEVQVPIHAPCAATPPTEPDYADTDDKLRNAPDHIERVKLLLIGRLQRIAHDQELHAYASACSG